MSTERAAYIPTKEVAVIIRQRLKATFPETKFSVRTDSYSGGSHVNVGWTDGPSPRQVDRAVARFCGRTFDGMDDSTHFHDSEWEGRAVHFAGSAPSTQRHITNYPARKAQAVRLILTGCVVTGEPGQERFGNDWVDTLADRMIHAADYRQADPLERAFRVVVLRHDEEEAEPCA